MPKTPCGQNAAAPAAAPEPAPTPMASSPAQVPVEKAPTIQLYPGQERFLLPSHSAGAGGIALMGLAGLPLSLILGTSYAAFQYYNPFIYFNAVGMCFMSLAVGLSVGWLGVTGGKRKGSLLLLFGLLAVRGS